VLSITGRAGRRVARRRGSLKIIRLAAVALFVVGAIAEARDTHTVWSQGGLFWMLLGFAAVAFEFAAPTYAARLHRR
jgi:predicted cobalt transporter CbtA